MMGLTGFDRASDGFVATRVGEYPAYGDERFRFGDKSLPQCEQT